MFNIHPINVPIVGVVENMAYFTPPELPRRISITCSGKGEGEESLQNEFDVPFPRGDPYCSEVSVKGVIQGNLL